MSPVESSRGIGIQVASILAILFGILTLKSGGTVLFIDGPAREAAGHYVPFVLWFNFIAGFFYIIAGVGLWLQRRWAVWLAEGILIATLVVFALFGWHIVSGGLFETRTVGAMTLRSIVWCVITGYAYYRLIRR